MKQRLAAFFAIFSLLVAGLVVGGVPATAEAAEARNFDPGNIISDQLFYNDNGMSTAAVQAVLNSRVSACRSGYTCLKDYRESTPNRAAVSGRCAAYSGGSQSAAEIIARVGVACGISQKVIMIMLEKEQSLITDTWPSARQYRSAMGYGCPDTADCDTNYYGFFNQVYAAALQFKNYQANPTRWNHVPGRYNAVRYNPNAACGSSTVYIQNAATAGLYNYTPYQPNASALANLYGTGDSCGAYGNRNFWRLYTDWFGPTTGSSYGSYDGVSGGYGGITVSGWAMNPNSTAAAYVWVNVNGVGGPFAANTSRSWFNTLYPGYGANHGFDATIAKPPGTYEVCVYNSTMNTLLGCKQVTVPKGAGAFDTTAQVPGGMVLTGWAVDYTTKNPTNVTVSVNGKAEPAVAANVSLPWINGYFPGIGANHGYSIKIDRPVGTYNVCVDAISGRLGCKTVTLASDEVGAFDTATTSTNALRVTGWAFDRSSTASTFVWVDVNGKGAAYRANTSLSWFEGMFPGAGKNHGYDITIPTTAGSNRVCVYGSATSKLLGCKTVNVPAPAEYGSFDTATAVDGGIKVTGWAYNSATKDPSYVWFDVNGVGTAVKANTTLSWFEGLFPGAGKNHGFDATLPKAAGTYRICAYGSATSVLLGCKTVTVPNAAAPAPAPKPTPAPTPAPVPAPTPTPAPSTATGSFDSVTPSAGSVRVTGWAYRPGIDPATTSAFVWVDIDGVGAAYRANSTLTWFDGLYPGAGTDHGFDLTIPASAGARTICVYESATSTKLGCKTTTVP